MLEESTKAITLLCCYSYEDKELSHELKAHLSILKRTGSLQTLYDREITAGTLWQEAIDQRIYEAHIILLLVSPDFLVSGYGNGREMKTILERHQQGQAYAIPVLFYPTDWKSSLLGTLAALPLEEKPVSSWPNRDEAFVTIAGGVREAIKFYRSTSAVRQKMNQLTLGLRQLSRAMTKIAYETQQISREIEQIKPDLASTQHLSSSSETRDLPAPSSTTTFDFTKEGWFKEYQAALDTLQMAVSTSVYQFKQIEEFHAS
jgi:TIR domain